MLTSKEFILNQVHTDVDLDALKIDILEATLVVSSGVTYFESGLLDRKDVVGSMEYLGTLISKLEEMYDVEVQVSIPDHYAGNVKDVISFTEDHFTTGEFVGAMAFNIIKYTTRLGRKDDKKTEIIKIRNYYERLLDAMQRIL